MSVLVLAIDDSATMRRSLDIAFSSDDFRLISRVTLAEGMEVARNDRPAIALLDASLPDTSLDRACSALRSELPELIVIALVANQQLLEPTTIERNAIADQVVKPFACDRLNEVVWRALRAEAERQREREERAHPPAPRALVDGEVLTPSRHRLAETLGVITGVEISLLRALGVEGISLRRDAVAWEGVSVDRALRTVTRQPGARTSFPLLVRDSAEVWESLASRGLVPMDWVGSTQRLFVRDGQLGEPQAAPDLGLIAAMAADVDLIFTAESLATEALPGPFEEDDPPFVWRLMGALETERLLRDHAAKQSEASDDTHAASAARQLLALGVAIDPIARPTNARWLCIPALGAPVRERMSGVVPAPHPVPCLSVSPVTAKPVEPVAPVAAPPPAEAIATPDLSPEASARRRALGDDLYINIERLDAPSRAAPSHAVVTRQTAPTTPTTPTATSLETAPTKVTTPEPVATDLPEPPQLERALWEVIPTMALDAIRRVFQQLKGD
jgi:DNA-binding response OmpR family regulator